MALENLNEATVNGSNSLLKPDVENELKFGQDTVNGNSFGNDDMEDYVDDVDETGDGERTRNADEQDEGNEVEIVLSSEITDQDERAPDKEEEVKEYDDASDRNDRNSFHFRPINNTATEDDKITSAAAAKNSIETSENADVLDKYDEDGLTGNNLGNDMIYNADDDEESDGKRTKNSEKRDEEKEIKVLIANGNEEQDEYSPDRDVKEPEDDVDDASSRNSFHFRTTNQTTTEAGKTSAKVAKNSIETGVNADIVERYGQNIGNGNDVENNEIIDYDDDDDEESYGVKTRNGKKQDEEKEHDVVLANENKEQNKQAPGKDEKRKEVDDDAFSRNSFHFKNINKTASEDDKTVSTTTTVSYIETGVDVDALERYDFDNNNIIVEAPNHLATDNATKTSANSNVDEENLSIHHEDSEITDSSLPIPSDNKERDNLIRQHTEYTGKELHLAYMSFMTFLTFLGFFVDIAQLLQRDHATPYGS